MLGLGAACLILLALGTSLILSALFSFQANRFLDSWQATAKQPSDKAWNIAFAASEKAIAWYPGDNAAFINAQGRILEWKQFTLPIGDPLARNSRLAALVAYRQATELRPTWPYTWGDLALIKARLGEVDNELLNALNKAFENGPWRSRVLERITQVGLLTWPQLPEQGRQLTLTAIANGINRDQRSANNIWKSIEALHSQAVVCEALATQIAWLEGPCS